MAATTGDDFGEEVYTGGQAGEGFAEDPEDSYYAAQGTAPAASAAAVAENEDDIYGAENGAQSRGGDDDEDDEVHIVLDNDNIEKPGGYQRPPGGFKSTNFRNSANLNNPNFSSITPGGSYQLRRTTTSATPGKSSQQQQKSIFELDIDSMDEKPWRKPGIDMTDYFNYGFNEDSWRQYCEKQSQMRLEQSMQSKIKVYESSRGDKESGGKQELPPELQAMVDGGDKNRNKRATNTSGRGRSAVQEDWPSRDRGFEHRRRPRDLDPAVVQITGGEEEDMSVPTEGMEEFYIPTSGGSAPPSFSRSNSSSNNNNNGSGSGNGFAVASSGGDYSSSSRDDSRRRDDDRKRDRDRRDDRRDRSRSPTSSSSSTSTSALASSSSSATSSSRSRDERRDRDKDSSSSSKDSKDKDKDKDRDRRRDRDERDKDKERERDDHKRKSSSSSSTSSSRDDDERKRRR